MVLFANRVKIFTNFLFKNSIVRTFNLTAFSAFWHCIDCHYDDILTGRELFIYYIIYIIEIYVLCDDYLFKRLIWLLFLCSFIVIILWQHTHYSKTTYLLYYLYYRELFIVKWPNSITPFSCSRAGSFNNFVSTSHLSVIFYSYCYSIVSIAKICFNIKR